MVDQKTKKALTIGGVVLVVILVLISLIAGLVWATKDRRATIPPTEPVKQPVEQPSVSPCDSWQTIPDKALTSTQQKYYPDNMGTSDLCAAQCNTDRCDWFGYDSTHKQCYTFTSPEDKTTTTWVKTGNTTCPYAKMVNRNVQGTIIQTYADSNQPNCQSNCDANVACDLFTFDSSNTCKTFSMAVNNDIDTNVRNI